MKKSLVPRIARHPFCSGMEPDLVALMEPGTELRRFRTNEQIFFTGSDAEDFYLIERGRVALQTPFVPAKGIITVQTLGDGDALGCSWFFEPYLWRFSALALEPTETLDFNALVLRRAAADHPAFGRTLATRIAGVLQQRLQATRLRLLELSEVPVH